MMTYVHLWRYLAELYLEWEMFQTKVVEEIKKHFLYSIIVPENRAVFKTKWENM